MDGIANVARQQQSQVGSHETQGKPIEQSSQVQQTTQMQSKPKQVDVIKEMQSDLTNVKKTINSKEQVEDLVKKLNDAMAPMSTDIRFGVDSQDIFYVSVTESKTGKMIRRFPAEQAQDFLPKMQEVSGILFDSRG